MPTDSSGLKPTGPAETARPPAALRVAAGLGAAAVLAFALAGFLDPAGLKPNEYWWLIVVAMALALAGFTYRTVWQRAGIVAATFMAGFGAQLALKDPYWFQHIRIFTTGFSYVIMAAIGLQGVISAAVLLRHGIFGHVVRVLSGVGWVRGMVLFVVLLAASKAIMDFIPDKNYPRYFKQLFLASTFLGINLANFVALLVSLPDEKLRSIGDWTKRTISLPGSSDQLRRLDRTLPYWVAGTVFAICLFIGIVAFEAVPHLDDIVYIFHAQYFADGLLSLPIPPSTEAFGHYLMDVYEDKWFSVNLPGWPAALAIGVFIGMPWIINPLLAGASVLLLHRFTISMSDRGTANLVILLMAISPWYLSMSSTGLLHTFTYALILAAWVLLLEARQRPSLWAAFLAGACLGWVFLTRPFEGLYVGMLTGLWTLFFLRDRRHWRTVVLYSLGCIVVGGLIFPYNAHLTGDPFTTPINSYIAEVWGPGANRLGFGPDIGAPGWGNVDVFDGHSPLEALINFQQNLYELNSELFGWGGFSLLFTLIFFLWGKWTRFTAAMAVIVVVTVVAYSLYWYVGGFYTGPRYWFLCFVPLLVFTVAGLRTCIDLLNRLYPDGDAALRIGVGIAFLGACSLLIFESWVSFNKFPEISGYHDDYQKIAEDESKRNALIFITTDSNIEFGSAFWLNDFNPASEVPLFARDLGSETNRKVASAFPGRKLFMVDGRSKDRNHVGVPRGPLTLDELE